MQYYSLVLGADHRIHVGQAHLFEQETDCILQRVAQPSKLLCKYLHHRDV